MSERIALETDLFEHRQVKSHFVNPCCFGEDFAKWLKDKLSAKGVSLGDPIQEDYGWGLFASSGQEKYWIAISYVGDGPQEPPPQWIISVEPDTGLNPLRRLFHKADSVFLRRVCDQIRDAVSSDPGIRIISPPKN
jgi:hypothetical protein